MGRGAVAAECGQRDGSSRTRTLGEGRNVLIKERGGLLNVLRHSESLEDLVEGHEETCHQTVAHESEQDRLHLRRQHLWEQQQQHLELMKSHWFEGDLNVAHHAEKCHQATQTIRTVACT